MQKSEHASKCDSHRRLGRSRRSRIRAARRRRQRAARLRRQRAERRRRQRAARLRRQRAARFRRQRAARRNRPTKKTISWFKKKYGPTKWMSKWKSYKKNNHKNDYKLDWTIQRYEKKYGSRWVQYRVKYFKKHAEAMKKWFVKKFQAAKGLKKYKVWYKVNYNRVRKGKHIKGDYKKHVRKILGIRYHAKVQAALRKHSICQKKCYDLYFKTPKMRGCLSKC